MNHYIVFADLDPISVSVEAESPEKALEKVEAIKISADVCQTTIDSCFVVYQVEDIHGNKLIEK